MGCPDDDAMAARSVGDLFATEPGEWGLPGDRYAWAALRERLAGTALPKDPAQVSPLVKKAFREVVGVDLDEPATPEVIYREEFDHGGTSSGAVHLPTWRDRLLPHLVATAREYERARARAAMKAFSDLQNELGLTE